MRHYRVDYLDSAENLVREEHQDRYTVYAWFGQFLIGQRILTGLPLDLAADVMSEDSQAEPTSTASCPP